MYICIYVYMYICIYRSSLSKNWDEPELARSVRKFTTDLGPCLEKVDYLCTRMEPAPCAPLNHPPARGGA